MSDLFQTIAEKAESKKQQRLMGMVRAVQKGEMKSPSETVAKLAQSMKKKDVKDFASTKHDDLPEKKEVKESAWQRKEGKNPSGGLNEKGRKSYERENPGSDLKAPQPEGGPRKRSFCARMGGMKGPMKDEKGRPTRKAMSLRRWKC